MTPTWSYIEKLKPFIQEAWQKSLYQTPTPIQERAIPLAVDGKDVIIESPTGTGKTVAYLLPLLEKIDKTKVNAQAVIVAPSHELVMQIYAELQKWSEGSGITMGSFIGGANVKRQLEKLKKSPQIIVGTPGRLLELIKQKKLKMHEVKTIVLDEGDQLLSVEHKRFVEEIVKSTLRERQLIFASATLPQNVLTYANILMNDPVVVRVDRSEVQNGKVEYVYVKTEQREKMELLRRITYLKGVKALAFTNDIVDIMKLSEKLQFKGVTMGVLHSDMDKRDREATIKSFRNGELPMLLVTDVAARGLDIEAVTHVVHVELPRELDLFVHRSGRTGRMGASGTVVALVTPREEQEVKRFARKLGVELNEKELFGGDLVEKRPEKSIYKSRSSESGNKQKKKKDHFESSSTKPPFKTSTSRDKSKTPHTKVNFKRP